MFNVIKAIQKSYKMWVGVPFKIKRIAPTYGSTESATIYILKHIFKKLLNDPL